MVGETLRNALGHSAILPPSFILMPPSCRSLAGMGVDRSKTAKQDHLEDSLEVDVICCNPPRKRRELLRLAGMPRSSKRI